VGRLDRHAAREDRAVNAPQVGPTGLERSLELAAMPPTWVVVLLVAPAVLGVCWLGYRGSGLGPLWRLGLATLRALALGLLCLILFRPVMVERFDHRLPPQVLVLVDDSASMRRKDAYASDASSDAAAKILGAWAAPLPLHEATRSALARAGLERELLPLLEQRGYEARLFAFSAGLRPLSKGLELAASGGTTQIGASLERALEQALGCHVTDVVIVSDGRQTAGPPAALASRAARGAGVDVHTVVVGDTRQEKNAWLELVEAPESALEGDEIAVSVRAAGVGLAAGEKVSVLLEERLADDEARGPILDTEERTLDEGGLRLTLEAGTEPGDPQGRERRFLIKIPPLEGETLRDDNQIEVSVRIVPEKVRVLYVEGYPRWEYRFLKELLKRSDENIRVQMMLLSATSDFPQESTRGEPSLLEVPCTREALLAQYDVVLLGDVSPWQVSPDPARAQQFLEALVQFVESGGGLAFLAGEYDNPRAYVSTPLEALVPVVLDSAELGSARVDTSRSFRPRLEDPGNAHEIVRLRPDPQENRSLWEEEGGLFPMYWYQPVTRVKPAAPCSWPSTRPGAGVSTMATSTTSASGARPCAGSPWGGSRAATGASSWRWPRARSSWARASWSRRACWMRTSGPTRRAHAPCSGRAPRASPRSWSSAPPLVDRASTAAAWLPPERAPCGCGWRTPGNAWHPPNSTWCCPPRSRPTPRRTRR
jgi:hypothetical protein